MDAERGRGALGPGQPVSAPSPVPGPGVGVDGRSATSFLYAQTGNTPGGGGRRPYTPAGAMRNAVSVNQNILLDMKRDQDDHRVIKTNFSRAPPSQPSSHPATPITHPLPHRSPSPMSLAGSHGDPEAYHQQAATPSDRSAMSQANSRPLSPNVNASPSQQQAFQRDKRMASSKLDRYSKVDREFQAAIIGGRVDLSNIGHLGPTEM